MQENSRAAADVAQKSKARAFVVQFDPVDGPRRRLRGRVELVASGDATHFHSMKQLVEFMVAALRNRMSANERSDG